MKVSFTLKVDNVAVAQFRDGALAQAVYASYITDIALDGEQDVCLRDGEGREIYRNTITRKVNET